MAITLPTATRNAVVDAIVDLIDGGSAAGELVFRTSANAVVATLTMSDPAFGAAVNGTANASAITSDTSATAGTIANFILQDSNDNLVLTGSVGVTSSGEDIELNQLAVTNGDTVAVNSLSLTMPAS